MFYLIYVSNATRQFNSDHLLDILRVSRESNANVSVTGMLLYKNRSFMQLLEGPEEVVRELLEKIKEDPRHYGLMTLQEGTVPERHFPDWSMAFEDMEGDASTQAGLEEFRDWDFTGPEFRAEPTRAHRLPRLFAEHMSLS